MPPIASSATGVRLTLAIQPRASRTELAGVHGDALKIRLTAPPVDGAANEALVRFLAEVLEVPRGAVTITAGQSGRRKTVAVEGISPEVAARRLRIGEA